MNRPFTRPGLGRIEWRKLAFTALAGSGLTVAGLGGPLTSGALAEAPSGSTTGGGEQPSTTTTPEPTSTTTTTGSGTTTTTGTGATTTGTTTTSTSTTPATTSTPAPAPPASTTPTPATSAPSVQPGADSGSGGETGAPTVVVHRKQQTSGSSSGAGGLSRSGSSGTSTGESGAAKNKNGSSASAGSSTQTQAGASNNVAAPPQVVAAQASELEAMLASSAVSAQALDFYRIPLFLLPIYQAAAVQYDVPWPILAAINEIETDYGTDLSVSSAGAEGWMQFEPGTWLQYGVDALDAGYADPYNPVDAIFATARYLHAAGASQNLSGAVFAYNHSAAYVESVLLRARLIAAYPDQVIATLTGLVDARPPVTGARIGWSAPAPTPAIGSSTLPSSSSATAGAVAQSTAMPGVSAPEPGVSASAAAGSSVSTGASPSSTPGSSSAPAPAGAAAAAGGGSSTGAGALQLVEITSAPTAHVVAVEDGRIVKLGHSRRLGRYIVLQDVYGDEFTYAGLGHIARTYTPAASQVGAREGSGAAAQTSGGGAGAGAGADGAGTASTASTASTAATKSTTATAASTGVGKVRAFAHPDNPDARVAVRVRNAKRASADGPQPLRVGSVVSQGTVLGDVSLPAGAVEGHLRFAIQPVGDSGTIDPRAILENWTQLDAALHPQGARGNPSLLGATAGDVFLMSKPELERAVLADPGIALSACSRHEVASGKIDARVLAAIAFLSRSGLHPTVGTLRCGAYDAAGYVQPGHAGDAVAIVAINGVPISGHQGAGSITDTTIRTLLTIQGRYAPARIVSLMRYPNAPSTVARADHGGYVELVFPPTSAHGRLAKAAAATGPAAHTAGAGSGTPQAPMAVVGELSAQQWEQLITRIAALPAPDVSVKPSSAAIPDR